MQAWLAMQLLADFADMAKKTALVQVFFIAKLASFSTALSSDVFSVNQTTFKNVNMSSAVFISSSLFDRITLWTSHCMIINVKSPGTLPCMG